MLMMKYLSVRIATVINCALPSIFSFRNCLQSEKSRFRQILCYWPVIPLGNAINTGSVNYISESVSLTNMLTIHNTTNM